MSGRSNIQLAAGVLIACISFLMSGCSGGAPTAAASTPEWTIQSASIAAKNKDADRYASCFSEERHRSELVSDLMLLTIQVTVRELAESEGPDSVREVDALLADDVALLTALGKDWAWLSKTSKLEDDEESKELENAVAKAANPGELWAKSLKKHPKRMIGWGNKIDNVEVNSDTATATVYDADNPRFDSQLKLKRVNGEWKIDLQ
jgi:hypothetical protein